MNKQIFTALAAVGLSLFVSMASAAPASFSGNQKVGPTSASPDITCALMGEAVNLGVSSKVFGALDCDEANNLVKVAACHEGGSRKGVTCTNLETDAAKPARYPAGCTATNLGEVSPTPSYTAFFTSSAGGVMAQNPMDGRCSEATLKGIDGFK